MKFRLFCDCVPILLIMWHFINFCFLMVYRMYWNHNSNEMFAEIQVPVSQHMYLLQPQLDILKLSKIYFRSGVICQNINQSSECGVWDVMPRSLVNRFGLTSQMTVVAVRISSNPSRLIIDNVIFTSMFYCNST